MELRHCFRVEFPVQYALKSAETGREFTEWLLKSNNPKVGPYLGEGRFNDMLVQLENESLGEILDILLREPLADYFWYGYPEHGGKLSYSLPHHDVVPGNALRVDKEKMKVFLRDIKLEKLLQ
jgi:hypothetical protein